PPVPARVEVAPRGGPGRALAIAGETVPFGTSEVRDALHCLDMRVVEENLRMVGGEADAQRGMLGLEPLDDGRQHQMIAEAPLRAQPEDLRVVIVVPRAQPLQDGAQWRSHPLR